MADAVAALLADLAAEGEALAGALRDRGEDDWLTPTAAWHWDVRDTVAHLADTDEIAIDTCTAGPRPLNDFAASLASPADTTYWGVLRGRKMPGPEVLAWWERARAAELEVLSGLEPSARIPWGLGMSLPAFVTARLMETWAHALDVYDAFGLPLPESDRVRHVLWIGIRAFPYAFHFAGEPPPPPIRVEVTLPSGETWSNGPEDASDRITGSATELACVLVQRRRADQTSVQGEGDGALTALRVARAFL
jgi:uncharacterized protein (TIGR03084 family)